jgi:hypothetical protein
MREHRVSDEFIEFLGDLLEEGSFKLLNVSTIHHSFRMAGDGKYASVAQAGGWPEFVHYPVYVEKYNREYARLPGHRITAARMVQYFVDKGALVNPRYKYIERKGNKIRCRSFPTKLALTNLVLSERNK